MPKRRGIILGVFLLVCPALLCPAAAQGESYPPLTDSSPYLSGQSSPSSSASGGIGFPPPMPSGLSAPQLPIEPDAAAALPAPPAAPAPARSRSDAPSEFEQFVAGKVEITEEQLAALKGYQGLSFSRSAVPPADGLVVVPVRTGTSAGYVAGPSEIVAEAFGLLGIRSSYAVSTDLKQFGYDLFLKSPSTFAPVDRVPVGPDYVLGPGDVLRISVWGKVEGRWSVAVDREGNIAIPKAGLIGVAGLSFAEAREAIRRELSKVFTGFDMNVSLGSLRTISVYVVGHAASPGSYSVSALSTLINVLFESGGPARNGSMRRIQVRRNNRVVSELDLYDFLLGGDRSRDVRLMPEDVVFIPPIGPVVAVAGSVNAPGLYELKDETGLSRLLAMAGGLSPTAFKERVQVERVADGGRQTVFESDLSRIGDADLPLMPGDVVRVFPVVRDRRVVRIAGAVHRGGEYGFTPGMRVKDLVGMAGGLKYYALRKDAELSRIEITEAGPRTETIAVDLDEALNGNPGGPPLRENDILLVRTVPEWGLYRTVTISGEVRHPGTYVIRKGEKLSSLIARAGGFTEKAYLPGSVFTRERVREIQQARIDEMASRLEKDLLGRGAVAAGAAGSSDEVRIREIELRQKKEFLEKVRSAKATGRMVVRIGPPGTFENSPFDIELESGDSLVVPPNPRSVQVMGSVYNQTAFVYDKSLTASRYIELAGGFTENADKDRVYVLKADGTAVRPARWGGIAWNGDANRWEFGGQRLAPGDTVVVPEKLETVAWMRETKDLTQVLYQIAVTAGVLIVAF